MEDIELELIPLDKLIKRLETDLKLAEQYREEYCSDPPSIPIQEGRFY